MHAVEAAAVAILVVAASVLLHFEALHGCHCWLGRQRSCTRHRVLWCIAVALASHVAQIVFFAGAFALLAHWGLGELHGQYPGARLAWIYFSAETYTSLGFGDLYPVGPIRMLVGIEALAGLLMIGWTATFTWHEISRQHEAP